MSRRRDRRVGERAASARVERAREVLDDAAARCSDPHDLRRLDRLRDPRARRRPPARAASRRSTSLLPPPTERPHRPRKRRHRSRGRVHDRRARSAPSGKERALLLFSDGNETEGSLRADVRTLDAAPPGLRVRAARAALAARGHPPRARADLRARAHRPAARAGGRKPRVGAARRRAPADRERRAADARAHSSRARPERRRAAVSVARRRASTRSRPTLALPSSAAPLPGRARAAHRRHAAAARADRERARAPVVATALAERGMHVEIVAPHTLAARIGDARRAIIS